MEKNVSNPISTGGGGPNFERAVGAYYLSCLLTKNIPRGLHIGTTEEVQFQRLFQDEPLDDLIVINKTPFGIAKLALQIKRDLSFGEKNETFDEVIEAAWQTFLSASFHRGTDHFGVCLALYSKVIDEHYQSVLNWAKYSATASDFFERVSVKNLSNQKQRDFVDLIRKKISNFLGSEVDENDLWEFLKAFVILRFDFHTIGSGDYRYTTELLKHAITPMSAGNAELLFDKLSNKYAANLNQTAGSINFDNLRRMLSEEDGFIFETPREFTSDVEKLNQHSDLILKNIKNNIGGVELNRVREIENMVELLNEHDSIGIVGAPGSGKSVILKALAQNQLNQGGTIVLSGDRISGTGWNSFASELGLTASLPSLLSALNNTPEPIVFIDGADRLLDPGSRQVVKDLISFLEESGFKKWKLVLSAREENVNQLYTWLDLTNFGSWVTYSIPELSESQLELIADRFPRIKPLLSVENLKPILRNPLMLDLVVDKRMMSNEEIPSIATEIELQNTWWDRIVGSSVNYGGTGTVEGRSRQIELLKIGDYLIKSPRKPAVLNASSPNVLLSLENDRILVRDAEHEVHRFGHDLFEDWILTRILNQQVNSLSNFIVDIGQPLGLYRPMELVGASILESEAPVENWLLLIREFEENPELSPRWRQALCSSPLVSTRVYEILNKISTMLLENNGKLLSKVLLILQTVEINPDLSLLPFVSKNDLNTSEMGFIPSALYTVPIPRFRVWYPCLKWLIENIQQLPRPVRHEVSKVFEIWQQRTPPKFMLRREIGEICFLWLNETEVGYQRNA